MCWLGLHARNLSITYIYDLNSLWPGDVIEQHTTGSTQEISQEIFKISILDKNLKFNNLRWQRHLPGALKLIHWLPLLEWCMQNLLWSLASVIVVSLQSSQNRPDAATTRPVLVLVFHVVYKVANSMYAFQEFPVNLIIMTYPIVPCQQNHRRNRNDIVSSSVLFSFMC